MSEVNGDSGSKDRATVALVNAKLDEVKAIIEGHAGKTEVQLAAIVKGADGLASRLSAIEGEQRAMAISFMALRDDYKRHKEASDERIEAQEASWRVHWPSFLPAVAALVIAGLALFL